MTAKIAAFFSWGLFSGGALMLLCASIVYWRHRPGPNPLQVREISVPDGDQVAQPIEPLRSDAADPS